MTAIAAVHQDFNIRQQYNNKEYDSSLQAFAFRQYTKAISSLHSLMSTGSQPLDLTLMACILFGVFDCLLGNHAAAAMHLKAGLTILEEIKERNPNRETHTYEWEREFAPLLLHLGIQVATFINPEVNEEQQALWKALKMAVMPPQPTDFWSLGA